MVEKILKVSENLVVIFFSHKPQVTVATDNGTALKLAIELASIEFKKTFSDAA